jgi:hypothetical protein
MAFSFISMINQVLEFAFLERTYRCMLNSMRDMTYKISLGYT